MMELLKILLETIGLVIVAITLMWAAGEIWDWFDRGPVNGAGDLPKGSVRDNLDFAEDMFKWDISARHGDGPLSLGDVDPQLAARIRAGLKTRTSS